jgi:hypothetical protein
MFESAAGVITCFAAAVSFETLIKSATLVDLLRSKLPAEKPQEELFTMEEL